MYYRSIPRTAAQVGWLLFLSCALNLATAMAGGAQSSITLEQATLEDLLNMEVTSASKKEQGLFRTAAAVYVLTSEDIRRSGATSIPDALRLVPGLQVATINGNRWAVSARGFNSLWANKLLVLVDGRVVYTPVTSGVHWDMLDVAFADIDRIEVVRGPGASVWGSNAVNGVINIISKAAVATQGGELTIGGGSLAPGIAAFRYGGRTGTRGHYRVFGKHSERGAMKDDLGQDGWDSSEMSSAGFRFDIDDDRINAWTLQGSLMTGEVGQRVLESLRSYAPAQRGVINTRSPSSAGHVLARWTRRPSSTSHMSVQAFWDRASQQVVGPDPVAQTFDVEFQHQFKAGRRHDLVWGAGERFWSDREGVGFAQFLDPSSSRRRVFNVFVQDEIAIASRARLTVGTKIEHQNEWGFEVQPTIRLAWLATPRQTAWAAISRAARAPSRLERALHADFAALPGASGQLTVFGVRGNPDLRVEHTVSYEAGYRTNPGKGISFEGTAFYHRYSDLVTQSTVMRPEATPAPAHLAIVQLMTSGMSGESFGAEGLVRWQPLATWSLDASADLFQTHFYDMGDGPEAATFANRDPSHQARLRSQLNLRSWQVDTAWTYVARLNGLDVPAYSRLDARIGRTIAGLDLSLVGQNLLNALHREFGGFEGIKLSQVPRSWVARATWVF